MTKEKIISVIRRCAKKLKRNPTLEDLKALGGIRPSQVRSMFGGNGAALRAAGLEPIGTGYVASTAALLLDWAAVARKLKRVPGADAYDKEGHHSVLPFFDRFKRWSHVPFCFRQFAKEQGIEGKWKDVLEMVRRHDPASLQGVTPVISAARPGPKMSQAERGTPKLRLRGDRPIYGAPLRLPGLGHEPVNEAGVIYLFGTVAHQLGLVVQRIQAGFPDCEALYEAQPGKWQRLRIEFEFASRNFMSHRHRADLCDVIVCWIHNWPECPKNLEVIELSSVVKGL
jgi:HNH endonuclease